MALVGMPDSLPKRTARSQRSVEYFEIPARSILNRPNPTLPSAGPSTPTGLRNRLQILLARYAHEFMELDSGRFRNKIYAKAAPATFPGRNWRAFRTRTKASPSHRTDPYQPPNARFERTRAILEVFRRTARLAVGLITKSGPHRSRSGLLRENRPPQTYSASTSPSLR